jgi:outer membrane protein assembly factor BamE (lipoprotein component of BamABCDE complex)
MIRRILQGLLTGVLAATLPACDRINLQELKPGVSTAFEVRDRMGAPTMEWKDADGSVTWEYPRTPEGLVNYMLVIGPDNVLREVRQVLTEENFARVQPGMRHEEIRRLLGKPAHQIPFELKKEVVWDWKTKSEPSMDWYFNVHFNRDGQVVKTSSNFVPRG